MNIFYKNNTGRTSKQNLIDGFVIRTKPFKLIFQEISTSNSNKPEQNYLIIGQRGAGKTTLLYRLKYEIEDRLKGSWGIIPVMLSEEQYNLSDLIDLWEYVAELLEEHGYFKGLCAEMAKLNQSEAQQDNSFLLLEDHLKRENKKIIIFIENIDVFFKKIGTPGQKKLRSILIESHNVRLIASATSYFDAVTDYSYPFYEFFKTIELKGLTTAEAKGLLLKIGQQYGQRGKIKSIIEKNPERLEALRRLTGGVPRTIAYLFQIFLDNENGKAIKDLYQLVDDLTFLYKSELDQLSPQQQKIIDVIAKNWDAIAVKDITAKTRFESKQISSILSALEKNQIIEKVNTKSKNHLYRIRERFMNIWYLMRFGKEHDKENVLWLVRFYDTWCDKTELTAHVNRHLKNLTDGKYDQKVAIYMGNTFLSCENVPEELRYSIYKKTRAILPRKSIEALQYSDRDLYKTIRNLIKRKNYKEATQVLEDDIEIKDEKYYMFSSFVYEMSKDYVQAEQYAMKYYDSLPENGLAALRVGIFNANHLNNIEKALHFFKVALKLKEYKAAYYIGNIYANNENTDMALQYFLLAAEHDIREAYMPIAKLYFDENNLEQAEKYCMMAIEAEIPGAHVNLGLIYEAKNEFDKAEIHYKIALKKGYKVAFLLLGEMEASKPNGNIDKAIGYLEEAVLHKVERAQIALGRLFLDRPAHTARGIEMLNAEVEKGNLSALHVLGHYYADIRDFEKSDQNFERAIRLGKKSAAICQAFEIFRNRRENKKKYALRILDESPELIATLSIDGKVEFASLLLWNDEIDRSTKMLVEQVQKLHELSQLKLNKAIESTLFELTEYFMSLLSKGLFNVAHSLFTREDLDLKNILKPVYFALMTYMKAEYPKEFLKAGEELKDTVQEIINDINRRQIAIKKRAVAVETKP